MIIAIDGPAGAGKSTIARNIARTLGFLYIDTGAMYRAITLKAMQQGLRADEPGSVIQMCRKTDIDLSNNADGTLKVTVDGRDVSLQIRQPEITKHVSDIARIAGVREVLVKLQRKLGKKGDSVLDGRDIGTVVFPDADKKFYLDARFQERVKRRFKELTEAGLEITHEAVMSDLSNRDTIDSTREHSPLKKADDAVYIDTTDMNIEEVVNCVLDQIKPKD